MYLVILNINFLRIKFFVNFKDCLRAVLPNLADILFRDFKFSSENLNTLTFCNDRRFLNKLN